MAMKPFDPQYRAIWLELFKAALTGICSQPSMIRISTAAEAADLALEEYLNRILIERQ